MRASERRRHPPLPPPSTTPTPKEDDIRPSTTKMTWRKRKTCSSEQIQTEFQVLQSLIPAIADRVDATEVNNYSTRLREFAVFRDKSRNLYIAGRYINFPIFL